MIDIQALQQIARRRGLAIIEDAAQAHGAKFNGLGPGWLSNAACFSFFPGKNLGAWGDAGAIVTDDADVARCARELTEHGRTDKYTHARVGFNARMDAIQAAVLNVKLPHLDDWNDARQEAAGWYNRLLADREGCVRPTVAPTARHVYHQYVIQVPNRDTVRESLREAGIGCGVHYPIPVNEQPAFRHLQPAADTLPVTSQLCRRILSLPIFPGIERGQVQRVADALAEAVVPEASVLV
jgi:dTDP-4-amino-4,6-dideoxygalactose transaminase